MRPRIAATRRRTVFTPNAFLRIGADNSVTVIAKHLEMGQGAYTGIATIVAEELDADWTQVRVESAPADAKRYANLVFGTMQGTGGSSAMANSWMQLREAGARPARCCSPRRPRSGTFLRADLTRRKGVVYHAGSKRQATFGSLVATAVSLPVPDTVDPQGPEGFQADRTSGLRVSMCRPRCDGTAQFTLDVALPGMLVALLKRAPRFGATVKSFDARPRLA